MADSAQDKTEAPTPRRRQEARSRGQIGRSTDLSAAVVLLGSLMVLYWSGKQILGRLLEVTRLCLNDGGQQIGRDYMTLPMKAVSHEFVGMVLPLMLVVFVCALATSFLQIGVLFTFAPLKPSFDKLNPLNGLKRMFSGRAFVHLALGLAKMSLLGLVAYATLRGKMTVLAHASNLSHLSLVAAASELVFTLGIRMIIILLILAILDFIYQRWRTENDLKMTREEVKEELKRMEGDPMIKRRRREIQMQLAIQRLKSVIPKADVVVTNPTELAIVIEYDADNMTAPKVTGKGADLLAKRIRELAIEHGIPIIERKPLAQALYKMVDVGQEIPSQFYKAVAEILAYVYELSGRRSRRTAEVGMN
jgi:flagellar biosynthesis protein FlhB